MCRAHPWGNLRHRNQLYMEILAARVPISRKQGFILPAGSHYSSRASFLQEGFKQKAGFHSNSRVSSTPRCADSLEYQGFILEAVFLTGGFHSDSKVRF
jgi:hypothetical protein